MKLMDQVLKEVWFFSKGALFEWLTVAENVNFGLRMKKKDPEETQKKS